MKIIDGHQTKPTLKILKFPEGDSLDTRRIDGLFNAILEDETGAILDEVMVMVYNAICSMEGEELEPELHEAAKNIWNARLWNFEFFSKFIDDN